MIDTYIYIYELCDNSVYVGKNTSGTMYKRAADHLISALEYGIDLKENKKVSKKHFFPTIFGNQVEDLKNINKQHKRSEKNDLETHWGRLIANNIDNNTNLQRKKDLINLIQSTLKFWGYINLNDKDLFQVTVQNQTYDLTEIIYATTKSKAGIVETLTTLKLKRNKPNIKTEDNKPLENISQILNIDIGAIKINQPIKSITNKQIYNELELKEDFIKKKFFNKNNNIVQQTFDKWLRNKELQFNDQTNSMIQTTIQGYKDLNTIVEAFKKYKNAETLLGFSHTRKAYDNIKSSFYTMTEEEILLKQYKKNKKDKNKG